MKILLLILLFPVFAFSNTFHIGTGAGSLNLANMAATYGIVGGDIVIINKGTYADLTVTNSRFSSEVFFTASDSGVTFTATCTITNVKNIRFDHFRIFPGSGRGLNLTTSDTTFFQNCYWYGKTDYQVHFDGTAGSYDGTAATRFDSIVFINDTFRACGFAVVMQLNGGRAVQSGLVIRDCWFDSTYTSAGFPSTCLSLNKSNINTQIYNCRFTNINLNGTDHNAVIYIQGWGKIYNNYCFNRQGNFVRARAYTIDSSASNPFPDTLFMFNLRDVSVVKYATTEHQQFVADTTTNTNLPNVRTGVFVLLNSTTLNGRTNDYFPFQNTTGGGSGIYDGYTWFRPPIIQNCLGARQYMDSIPNPASPNPLWTFNYMLHDGGGFHPVGMPTFGDTAHIVYRQTVDSIGIRDSLVMNIDLNSPARGNATSQYSYLFNFDWKLLFRRIWDAGAAAADRITFVFRKGRGKVKRIN